MHNSLFRRTLCIVLTIVLCLGLIPTALGLDLESSAPVNDTAAFGDRLSGTTDTLMAWTNDAADEETMRALLNDQTLLPQRTGWKELDELLASMLADAGEDADTYDKLRYMYDWLVKNVTYSWNGYSYQTASVKCYNSFTKDYLSELTYEEGLQKSIPDDMANRTYHILTAKQGVCYDYAIAIAVIGRYIGLETYVHTGLFSFEDTSLGAGHHGWAVFMLDGKKYVFDPQRDARNYQYYLHNGYYFGIPEASATRYFPNYSNSYIGDNKTANAKRDAEMLPLDATRNHMITVTLQLDDAGDGTGTFTGGGNHVTGDHVTLTATADYGCRFKGWYSEAGKLLSDESSYTFTAEDDVTILASFYACPSAIFPDVPADAWYHEAVNFALKNNLFNGITTEDGFILFSPDMAMSRGMLVTVLYRMSGDEVATASDFSDVAEDAWYAEAVAWAQENDIVNGTGNGTFCPDDDVTREQIATILYRYAQWSGQSVSNKAELDRYPDLDQVDDWALEAMEWAIATEVIHGTKINGTLALSPLKEASRAEVAQMLNNYIS